MRTHAVLVVLAALGLRALTSATSAQEVAAWRVECTGDGKTLDCRAVQQLFQRETRQLVLSVLVRKAPDPKSAQITIQLPLGLNLTEPVQLKIDNGQAERQSIQTCTNIGCFVLMTASERFLNAMRAGHDLKLTFQDANKKPVELAVPLLGFAVAFDKVRA
jgi:invasion protein IalB